MIPQEEMPASVRAQIGKTCRLFRLDGIQGIIVDFSYQVDTPDAGYKVVDYNNHVTNGVWMARIVTPGDPENSFIWYHPCWVFID